MNSTIGVGELPFQLMALTSFLAITARILLVVEPDAKRHCLRIKQALLQTRQHAALEALVANDPRIGAAGSVSGSGASPVPAPDLDPAGPAHAATSETRQEMLRAALGLGMCGGAHLQLRLDLLPDCLVYDPKFRNRLHGPSLHGVRADADIPAYWLDDLAGSVVNEFAGVNTVAQHTIATLPAPLDGSRLPGAAARAPDAFGVQALRDLPCGLASCVLPEDANHDRRLIGFDFPEPPDELPTLVDPVRGAITVSEAGGSATFGYPALLGPLDVVREFLALLFVEQSLYGALERVDFTVAQREKPRPAIIQAIADVVGVTLISRDPAARVGEHLIDPSGFNAREERVHAWTLTFRHAGSSTDCGVAEYIDDDPAFLLRALDANANLIVN